MCYNCGCGKKSDDHGKGHAGVDPDGKALTEKSFAAIASAFDMSPDQTKKNSLELLEKETRQR